MLKNAEFIDLRSLDYFTLDFFIQKKVLPELFRQKDPGYKFCIDCHILYFIYSALFFLNFIPGHKAKQAGMSGTIFQTGQIGTYGNPICSTCYMYVCINRNLSIAQQLPA